MRGADEGHPLPGAAREVPPPARLDELYTEEIEDRLVNIDDQRLFVVAEALRRGFSPEKINKITKIDMWFLTASRTSWTWRTPWSRAIWTRTPCAGPRRWASPTPGSPPSRGRAEGDQGPAGALGIRPAFKMVDTCAAEFEPRPLLLLHLRRGERGRASPLRGRTGLRILAGCMAMRRKRKVLVLGSGPIRIGQGIEFDYCSVHSVWAFKRLGYETIIINNNPETVSTDFDVADKLYFEPLTAEDVEAVVELEKPWGAVVQFGGQTAIKLAQALTDMGVPILGTSSDGVDAAEDRERLTRF